MHLKKNLSFVSGIVLLYFGFVYLSKLKKEVHPEVPTELQAEIFLAPETAHPIAMSTDSESSPKKELAELIKKIKENPCDAGACSDFRMQAEDTAEQAEPEGMLVRIQTSNTSGSRAIVSSQLCSVYAYLDQDDFAELEIFEDCDLFVYKKDGAFRSYTEEYFVEYVAGGEVDLSFTFPEERIGGMGVSIYKIEDGFEISYIFPDSPAAELGLEIGDIIVEVNGETTYDLSLDDFLQLTTGYEGTKATFRLKGDGKNQPPHVFTRKVMDFN